ncbi:hypothetical protein XPA_003874 [Xanthoria parietina]
MAGSMTCAFQGRDMSEPKVVGYLTTDRHPHTGPYNTSRVFTAAGLHWIKDTME